MSGQDAAGFKDHFSPVAGDYASFRPTYPQALFEWLATLPAERCRAWDCATGSGQAALGLIQLFERVIATDASAAQIEAAIALPGVEYRIVPAENSGLDDNSVDLISVAQALHWFDLARFYAEARRVLKPGGILAVWTYGIHATECAPLNQILHEFYSSTVGPYWPPERKLVESGYRTLDFPFDEIAAPPFAIEQLWALPQLAGYMRSWSATSRFIADRGFDPTGELEHRLSPLWGTETLRKISWPLALRVGRKS